MQERNADLKVIVILLLINSIVSISLPFIYFKSSLTDLFAILSATFGIISLVATYELWNLKFWGFMLTLIVYSLTIANSLLRRRLLNIVLPAVILIWLFQNKAKFR